MSEPLPMFHAGKARRCIRCDSTRLRETAKGKLVCADCEKARINRRKAQRRGEQ